MIHPRQLAHLLFALALSSTALLAEPAPPAKVPEPAVQAPDKSAPAQPVPAASEQAPKSKTPKTGKDSPFDYHSSEQISEDLPVSFPVDI